ncbi:MAG: hypothetical protein HQM13_17305 [SAR324 cluster bacterium]|nr:hypothetical protein [SAR324 cluster bacterium]
MKRFGRHWKVLISIAICWFVSANIYAQSNENQSGESQLREEQSEDTQALSEETDEGEISINLPEKVTLEQLTDIIAHETDTLFIYQKQNLRGELFITMPSNFKVKKKDIFAIFEKLLTTQGLTLLRRDNSNIVEIIPGKEARFSKLPFHFDDEAKNGNSENLEALESTDFVMRLRQVKHADLNKIKAAIQPFFSSTGTLLHYDLLRILIMVDSKDNIERISEIIDTLDVDDPEDLRQVMTVYKMKNTKVADTHKMVSSIYANILHSGRQEPVKFIIENRQNALIFFTTKEATVEVKALLDLIDVPVDEDPLTELTIHTLNFVTPGSIAPLLVQIFTQKAVPVIKTQQKAPPPKKEPAKEAEKEAAPVNPSTASPPPVQIIPFDNLNALIIIADKGTTKDVIELAGQLDVDRGKFDVELYGPLKFASAKVLGPLLATIFSDQIVAGKGQGKTAAESRIKIIPETRLNSLILIGDRFTLQEIKKLIIRLDVGGGDADFYVHQLEFAKAQNVASLINSIFTKTVVTGKEKEAVQELLIVPDERLNQLIIFADKTRTSRILGLIEKLDLPAEEDVATSEFKLYRLQHAVAKDISGLLKEVTGYIVEVAKSDDTEDPAPVQVPQPAPKPEAGKDGSAPAAQGAAAPAQPVTGDDKKSQLNKETASRISISADESTNSLLIFGPTEIFETLDRIIQQLDIPRVQVYIEALIMETSLSKSLNFGVDWSFASPSDDNSALISTGFPGASPLTVEGALQKSGTSALGVVSGGTLEFEGKNFLSFGAFIRAIQNDSDINILAHPQLLMLNNEQASLNVSRVIPVATNSVVDANGRVTDQIEFRDVGVIASIKPQISGDNSIRLEIQQTSSDVTPTPVGNSNAVTTFKRELKTAVVTASDSIVVLGGLLNEQLSQSESKIPGLGDLPLIGWLFGNSSERVDKTNLMMFIRPTIIRNQQDLIRVTEKANARYQKANVQEKSFRDMLQNLQKNPPTERLKQ